MYCIQGCLCREAWSRGEEGLNKLVLETTSNRVVLRPESPTKGGFNSAKEVTKETAEKNQEVTKEAEDEKQSQDEDQDEGDEGKDDEQKQDGTDREKDDPEPTGDLKQETEDRRGAKRGPTTAGSVNEISCSLSSSKRAREENQDEEDEESQPSSEDLAGKKMRLLPEASEKELENPDGKVKSMPL
jgi:hypothetical protein